MSLMVAGAGWFAVQQSWIDVLPSYFFRTLILLVLSTFIMYGYLSRSERSIFVQLYLLMMTVKLLAYAGYNFFMIRSDPGEATGNVSAFLAIYLLSTAIEVAFLYQKINR